MRIDGPSNPAWASLLPGGNPIWTTENSGTGGSYTRLYSAVISGLGFTECCTPNVHVSDASRLTTSWCLGMSPAQRTLSDVAMTSMISARWRRQDEEEMRVRNSKREWESAPLQRRRHVARSITCRKNAQKSPTSPGNCSFNPSANSTAFLASPSSLFKPNLLAQSHRRSVIATSSAFMTLSKKDLKVSVEGLSTNTMEIPPSANSLGDRPNAGYHSAL
jgi:hypothetical protein